MTKLKAEFVEFNKHTNWVAGKIGEYVFEAKLFDNSSIFGIKDGRISKLSIRGDKNDGQFYIANYDRGWDIEPKDEDREIFDAVVELLENSPRRFDN